MKIMAIFIILILAFFGACQHPTDDGMPQFKSPRNMIWAVDTLYPGDGFQFLPEDIWGSSPQDVFVVGYNTNRDIFHYDGEEWETLAFHVRHGGTIPGAVNLNTVFGFSAGDVWFGGEESYYTTGLDEADSAIIVHYDGTVFSKIPIQGRTEKGYDIYNIWGSDPENVWFAGTNGEIYHWDGAHIGKVELPLAVLSLPDDKLYTWVTGNSRDNTVVYFLSRPGLPTYKNRVGFFYYYSPDNSWQKITDTEVECNGCGNPWMSPEGTLYFDGLYKWENSQPVYLTSGAYVYGTSDNNLILRLSWGYAPEHYNGADWQEIEALKGVDLLFTGTWMNEQEVFFTGLPSSGNAWYVYHGN